MQTLLCSGRGLCETSKDIGGDVSAMPTTGHLATISQRKYGSRTFPSTKTISKTLASDVAIDSDEHPVYA